MRLVVFDPALRTTGVAVFANRVLVDAYAVRVRGRGRGPSTWGQVARHVWDSLPDPYGLVDEVVLEGQVVYPGAAHVDPNDILQVSGVAGGLAAFGAAMDARLFHYDPAAWKGQVPKEVMAERSRGRLSAVELGAVRAGSTLDTWDAIGIGLHHLRRLHART